MAADLILTLTNTGDELELDSLIEGAAIPKLMNFVIGMGDAVTEEADIKALTEVPDAFATKLSLGSVQRFPNGGGAKLFGHFTLDLRLPEGKKVTGIGVELADGSLYGYTPYYPLSGGVEVPLGMAFTFYVILAKLNAKVLTVKYEPYDTDAMADIVIEKANANFQTLPFYPVIETGDNKLTITDNLDGTITVDSGQTFWMRTQRFLTDDYTREQRTFTVHDSDIYHLRFNHLSEFKDNHFTLNDLSSLDYNPDQLDSGDTSFNSSFDDMLIAMIGGGSVNSIANGAVDTGDNSEAVNASISTLSAFATIPTVNANDMSVVDDGEEFLVFVARGVSPLQMTPVSYDGVVGSTIDLPFAGYYMAAFKQAGSVFFAIAVGDSVKLYEYVKSSNVATQVDTLSGYKLYGLHVFIDTQDRVFFGVMGANSSNQGAVTSGNARVFFRATKDDAFSLKYTSSSSRSTTVGLSEVNAVIWINASGKLHVFDEVSKSFTTRSALITAWSSYYNNASFIVKHPTDTNKMLVVAWAGYGTYVNYVYEVHLVNDTSVNTATLDGAIGSPVGIQATDSGFSLLLSNGEVYGYDVTLNDFVSPASLSVAIPATALPRAHAQNQMVADSGKLVYSVPVSGTGNSELYATG